MLTRPSQDTVTLTPMLYELYRHFMDYRNAALQAESFGPGYAAELEERTQELRAYIDQGLSGGVWSQDEQQRCVELARRADVQVLPEKAPQPFPATIVKNSLPTSALALPTPNGIGLATSPSAGGSPAATAIAQKHPSWSQVARSLAECVEQNLECPVKLLGEHDGHRFHTVYFLPQVAKGRRRIAASTLLAPKFKTDLIVYGALPDTSFRICPQPGRLAFEIEKEQWSPALFGNYVTAKECNDITDPFKIRFGLDTTGEPVSVNLSDPSTPHVLIVGGSGSGKTSAQTTFLVSAMTQNLPEHLRILLIDAKGSLGIFDGTPWMWRGSGVISDRADIKRAIGELLIEQERRYAFIHKHQRYGVRSFEGYNRFAAKRQTQPMARLLVLINEKGECGSIDDGLGRLLKGSREAGMNFVIGAHRPTNDITPDQRNCLASRLVLKLDTPEDYKAALGDSSISLIGHGDCLFWQRGRSIRTQVFLCPDDHLMDFLGIVRAPGALKHYEALLGPGHIFLHSASDEDAPGDAPEDKTAALSQEMYEQLKELEQAGESETSILRELFGHWHKAPNLAAEGNNKPKNRGLLQELRRRYEN
ncbi:MAG: FtsK/SpoIIIE domain-containing protein [Elainellaceae cyanobacterium]